MKLEIKAQTIGLKVSCCRVGGRKRGYFHMDCGWFSFSLKITDFKESLVIFDDVDAETNKIKKKRFLIYYQ